MTSKELIIVGAGGFARETLWIANVLAPEWNVIGFLDDSGRQSVDDLPVLGRVDQADRFKQAWFAVAIGDPRVRNRLVSSMSASFSPNYATLVHPNVLCGHKVIIGEGSIVTAGCILTTGISLGKHNIVNLNTTIGHDVVSGDFCTFAPIVAISGNVKFGSGVEVGTGAAIKQGVEIGNGAVVGMSACVVKKVDSDTVVIGNPAKLLKNIDQKWMA